MDRRRFLSASAGAASIAFLAERALGKQSHFFGSGGQRLGLELYTVSDELQKDFEGTLLQVRQAGYEHVEIAGLHGHSPREFAAALQAAGLTATSAHFPATSVKPHASPSLEDMELLVDACGTLGLKYVFLPVLPVEPKPNDPADEDPSTKFVRTVTGATRQDYLRCAQLLNRAGAQLAAHGVQIGYHSHNFEFAPLGDTTGFDVLLENTDPGVVGFELDVGWLVAAGLDPVAMLKKHPQRFRALHVKDVKASTKPNFALRQDPSEIGAGVIPWPKILPLARSIGVREYFVEQEPPFPQSAMVAIKRSADYLKTLPA